MFIGKLKSQAVNYILWSSNYDLPNPSTCSRWRSMASLSRRRGVWESEGRMYKPPPPTELSEWTAEQFFLFRKFVNIIGQFGQASLKTSKGWKNVNTPKRSRFLTGLTALQAISIVTCFFFAKNFKWFFFSKLSVIMIEPAWYVFRWKYIPWSLITASSSPSGASSMKILYTAYTAYTVYTIYTVQTLHCLNSSMTTYIYC